MDLLWACEIESLRAYCDRVLSAPEEDARKAFIFFLENDNEEPKSILSVDGDTATIEITGTLTNNPSPIARLRGMGTTSYTAIQEAIAEIAENEAIKNVRLVIDSPGGNVTGLDEVWMAVRELSKTKDITAENHGLMASAAYWIATAADQIVATSPAAETGSIGVYLLVTDWTKYDERVGIRDIRIVSKNAPLKNPDPATKDGLQAFQDRLDALERVFISRVSEGRGVSIETVEKTFGRGGLFVAADPDTSKPSALSVGMIDQVIGVPSAGAGRRKKKAEEGGDNSHVDSLEKTVEKEDKGTSTAQADTGKGKNMKHSELAAKDPELLAEVDGMISAAKTAGKEEGKTEATALIKTVSPVLTGEEPKYIKDLAVKVLAGDATEAELKAARDAYAAATEAAKTTAAVKETDEPGPTPPAPPVVSNPDSPVIQTEEDHQAQVARFRADHGMEEN